VQNAIVMDNALSNVIQHVQIALILQITVLHALLEAFWSVKVQLRHVNRNVKLDSSMIMPLKIVLNALRIALLVKMQPHA
jgi:hypothetical protein